MSEKNPNDVAQDVPVAEAKADGQKLEYGPEVEVELVLKIADACNKIKKDVVKMRMLIEKLQPNEAITLQGKGYSLRYCNEIQDLLLEIKKAEKSSLMRTS